MDEPVFDFTAFCEVWGDFLAGNGQKARNRLLIEDIFTILYIMTGITKKFT